MSSIPPASSISSQPPVSYTPPPPRQDQDQDSDATDTLTATAVAAQSAKDVQKGAHVDIKV